MWVSCKLETKTLHWYRIQIMIKTVQPWSIKIPKALMKQVFHVWSLCQLSRRFANYTMVFLMLFKRRDPSVKEEEKEWNWNLDSKELKGCTCLIWWDKHGELYSMIFCHSFVYFINRRHSLMYIKRLTHQIYSSDTVTLSLVSFLLAVLFASFSSFF